MLAICLLTADRADYTNQTLTTFCEHNGWESDKQIRLHADDGSKNDTNVHMADAAGFLTCYRSTERRGVMPALRYMWRQAIVMGATHILHLENDCVSLAPLPSENIYRSAESTRLYGRFKGLNNTYPTGPHIMGTKEVIQWKPTPAPGWEYATCHWGAQPSITRAGLLHLAIERAERLKDVSTQLLRIDTIRPRWNILAHIGEVKTDGARFHA